MKLFHKREKGGESDGFHISIYFCRKAPIFDYNKKYFIKGGRGVTIFRSNFTKKMLFYERWLLSDACKDISAIPLFIVKGQNVNRLLSIFRCFCPMELRYARLTSHTGEITCGLSVSSKNTGECQSSCFPSLRSGIF